MLVCNTLIHRFKSGLRLLSEKREILKNSVSLFFYVFEYQDRSECGNIVVNVCKIGMDAASHVEGSPGRKSGDSGSVVC